MEKNNNKKMQLHPELPVSVNTLKAHIKSAYLKPDVYSRTTAIARLRKSMIK